MAARIKNIAVFRGGRQTIIAVAATAAAIIMMTVGWRTLQAKSDQPAHGIHELDQRTVQAQNRFGLQVWGRLVAESPQQNVAISPYSITTALSMAMDGAAGITLEAMRKALQLGDVPADEVKQNALVLRDLITHSGKGTRLTTANSLWLQKNYRFVDQYLKDTTKYYGARLTSLELGTPAAMNRINDWVKANTGGKISKILDVPPAPANKMVLVNAVYFKGEWANPFSTSATKDADFYLSNGTKKTVPLMSEYAGFEYMESADYQAVRLPYRGDRMNMLVLLPNVGNRLEDIQGRLIEHPEAWLTSYPRQNGTVELPRFKLEYGNKLNDALSALGMGIAFDKDEADFSRMAPTPPSLYIGSVDHKAYLEVDEKGTKAAAATSVSMTSGSAPSTKPFQFRADRPFMIVIQDRLTNEMLFVGSVNDPG